VILDPSLNLHDLLLLIS
jgi:hypothetical protein